MSHARATAPVSARSIINSPKPTDSTPGAEERNQNAQCDLWPEQGEHAEYHCDRSAEEQETPVSSQYRKHVVSLVAKFARARDWGSSGRDIRVWEPHPPSAATPAREPHSAPVLRMR